MPTSISAILIIVLAVFPGAVGDLIYRTLVGVTWREKEWQSIFRLLGFSICGLALYTIVTERTGWLSPIHVFPSSYTSGVVTPKNLSLVFIPYAGHFIGATIAGLIAAGGMRALSHFRVFSLFDAWDGFVRYCVPRHWVVISLKNSEVYAGIIEFIDRSVKAGERDIVLKEPAQYKREVNNYVALEYQYLFIPASLVMSIAVCYDQSIDKERITTIGEYIFTTESLNEQRETIAPAAAPSDSIRSSLGETNTTNAQTSGASASPASPSTESE